MPRTTLAGHPLHPQLISAPVALLPTSFVFDVLALATRKKSFADAAWYTMIAGYIGALAAAPAGAGDYFAIRPGTHAKRVATLHALMNAGLVGLYGLNLASRRSDRRPGIAGLGLSALGTAGLAISAWYGGSLVYRHGVRVQGKDDLHEASEVKLPVDHQIEEFFTRVEEITGVTEHDGYVAETHSMQEKSATTASPAEERRLL